MVVLRTDWWEWWERGWRDGGRGRLRSISVEKKGWVMERGGDWKHHAPLRCGWMNDRMGLYSSIGGGGMEGETHSTTAITLTPWTLVVCSPPCILFFWVQCCCFFWFLSLFIVVFAFIDSLCAFMCLYVLCVRAIFRPYSSLYYLKHRVECWLECDKWGSLITIHFSIAAFLCYSSSLPLSPPFFHSSFLSSQDSGFMWGSDDDTACHPDYKVQRHRWSSHTDSGTAEVTLTKIERTCVRCGRNLVYDCALWQKHEQAQNYAQTHTYTKQTLWKTCWH